MIAASKSKPRKGTLTFSKIQPKTIFLWVAVVLSSLCCGGVFDGQLAFGIFVGATYSGNPLLAALFHLATSAVFGWQNFFQACVRTGVVLAFVAIHQLAKHKIRKPLLLLYLVAANAFYCVFDTEAVTDLVYKVFFTCCGIAFSFVSIYVFRAVFVRGIAYKPAIDEKVCISLFVTMLCYGAAKTELWGMNFAYFVIPFALLFCSSVVGDSATLVCGVLLGLGSLLATADYSCFAFCAFCSVTILMTARLNRYVAALSVVIVDVLMAYFLDLHGTFSTLVFVPTACSVVAFVAVPGGALNYLRDCVCGNSDKYLGKSVVKKLSMHTARKLYRLSDIFLSMKNAFFSMSGQAISAEQAQNAIVRQCSESVCKDCPENARCWRTNLAETENGLVQIAECAVKRGKCTILDVPQNLSLKCSRISTLLAEINLQCNAFREYSERVEQVNGGKLLLGEQLGGVSQLLSQLAGDCKGKITYNTDKEKELAERLTFHNILCCGAVVMEQTGSVSVIVTVSKKDLDLEAVCQITSKLLCCPMSGAVEDTDSPHWVNVVLNPKPRFSVSFGVSAVTKNDSEISGDTHSVVKTDNGKCIVALCDGMGSGQRAQQSSETAIGLVENFYRAGFDSDVVLSCVNRLLVGNGNEVFCAVDICVLDLFSGLVDFIKLGAPTGFIKSRGGVETLDGSSLPLGVLDEMKPTVSKKALSEGDFVVLMSDGVTDVFNDPTLLAEMIGSVSCTNPQSVSDVILSRALKAVGGKAKDDMTVLCVKVV